MPARSGGISLSCWRRCSATSSTISCWRWSPPRCASSTRSLDAFALLVDDLAQPLGDVLVHAAEVVALEHLLPTLAEALHHVAQAHELLAVAVLEALLEHPAHRGVEIAVVQEVVGHLVEQGVGVEVEALLRAVPARSSGTPGPLADDVATA